jgi:acyl carrier protein
MSDFSLTMQGPIDVAAVRAAVIETLGIDDVDAIDSTTPLFSIPELDSMAVMELVVELERRFGITFEDEDLTAEVFETIESLAAYVQAKSG